MWLGMQISHQEAMRNLIRGQGLVVLSNNGLIQVLQVEADMKGSIMLVGMGQGRYPIGWPGDWGYDTKCDHVIQGFLNLVTVLYMYLPLGLLDCGNGGICANCVSPRHVAYGVKGARECPL